MIIQKVEIAKFRGFKEVEFELGKLITVIAGQNGTQKTTILGMLSQPFTLTDTENPTSSEKPLSGGTFKSAFGEKFKLSQRFDIAKSHEWTLHLTDGEPFMVESISRGNNKIRFWRKGSREKGSGYIQLPVIFLSLKRLIPIGEDNRLVENSKLSLTDEEKQFISEWHQKILLSFDVIKDASFLESPDKNTLGVNTDIYDWKQNSSGQDNIGKILLAILSFKRLKDKYPEYYKGGILAIDELDTTLYPASQIKLLEALRKFASKYSIQVIFTTHSLTILEEATRLETNNKHIPSAFDQIRVIYLERFNSKIKVVQGITYSGIKHKLNVTLNEIEVKKIDTFTEDKECTLFVKAILKGKATQLKFIDCTLPASSLVELGTRKVPSFSFPNSVVFIDGDMRGQPATMKKIKQLKNFVLLPGVNSPERLLADFLYNLSDDSPVWENINATFNKQYCFKDYTLSEIQGDRQKAKLWFNAHLQYWGANAIKVINPWMEGNKEMVNQFVTDFVETYNKFAKELSLKEI